MNERRQHLAWLVLLAGFFLCISLIVLVPVGINAILQGATRSLNVSVQANQGTVGVRQNEGEPAALFAGSEPIELLSGGSVLTNATDTALLLSYAPDNEELIARVQIYGNTNLQMEEASTPRFESSVSPRRIRFLLDVGRMHLTVPQFDGRPVEIEVITPQGSISVNDPGQYSVVSTNLETQFAVLQGQAEVVGNGDRLSLLTDQRAIIPTGGEIQGPVDTERNLVVNGDFSQQVDGWVPLASNVEIADQQPVELAVTEFGTEPAIRFKRVGIGHADAGLRQLINQDVTDFDNMILVISMIVTEQSLGVCGERGSECPLIVRIEYVDENNVDQTWQQGFYAVGEFSSATPDVCIACPPPLNEHQRITFGQLVFYESDNLLEQLDLLGILPVRVKSITLISSGHTFDASVIDVALMARE
jgi:hypothetical protein